MSDTICPPSVSSIDIHVKSTNTDEVDLSDRIAAMLNTTKDKVIATSDGAGIGTMRVVIPDDALRSQYLAMLRTCTANNACQNSGVTSLDKDATKCPALSHSSTCNEQELCSFEGNLCTVSAAAGEPTPVPDSDDGTSFADWWYWLVLAIFLLLLAFLAYKLTQKKDPPPPSPASPSHSDRDISLRNEGSVRGDEGTGYWSDGGRKSPAARSVESYGEPFPPQDDPFHPLVGSINNSMRPPPAPSQNAGRGGGIESYVKTASPISDDPLGPLGRLQTQSYTYVPRATSEANSYNRLPV